jgi:hypothetical protein
VGAFVNNERPRTKKALREALAADPDSVRFDQTSLVPGGAINDGADIRGSELPVGPRFAVTGPDPYIRRRWYATVCAVNGEVTCI